LKARSPSNFSQRASGMAPLLPWLFDNWAITLDASLPFAAFPSHPLHFGKTSNAFVYHSLSLFQSSLDLERSVFLPVCSANVVRIILGLFRSLLRLHVLPFPSGISSRSTSALSRAIVKPLPWMTEFSDSPPTSLSPFTHEKSLLAFMCCNVIFRPEGTDGELPFSNFSALFLRPPPSPSFGHGVNHLVL